MSLLNQPCDGSRFDIFITGETVTWQLKTAWCQIWIVWWMLWCFLTKLLQQVLSLVCCVWPGTLMEENCTISKTTNMFSPVAYQMLFSVVYYQRWCDLKLLPVLGEVFPCHVWLLADGSEMIDPFFVTNNNLMQTVPPPSLHNIAGNLDRPSFLLLSCQLMHGAPIWHKPFGIIMHPPWCVAQCCSINQGPVPYGMKLQTCLAEWVT